MEQDIETLAQWLGWYGYAMENFESYEQAMADPEIISDDGHTYLSDWNWWVDQGGCQTFRIPEVGEVYFHGSFEYLGNRHVLAFTIDGQDYIKEGEWISHDGMYWDGGFTKGRPKQMTLTIWESVA